MDKRTTLQHCVRGCGYLPDMGEHPGTLPLLIFICTGAMAGMRGGWPAALAGTAFMAAIIGPMFLSGAYYRSVEQDQITEKPSDEATVD